MIWQAWVTIGVLLLVVSLLTFSRIAPDVIMLGAITLLLTLGVVDEKEALGGFANEGMLTVAVLFVVAAGVRETGGMAFVAQRILGKPQSVFAAQARMMVPTAVLSAVMNNTPLVAIMLPVVADWAKKHRIAPSKVMMPLSFATILGGLCTLIGTSTNIVVSGLIAREVGQSLQLFDPLWVGLPCALVGLAYILVGSRWILPDRKPVLSDQDDARQYTVEMLVDLNSSLVGQTIEEAGLRHLPGLYLAEIERDGQVLPAVASRERLHGGDRLVFVGVVESVVDLQKIRGLQPATSQVFKLNVPRTDRCLVEAVVSNSCPSVGMTIREGRFRSVYDSAVIALARNGERMNKKLGDIVLQAGDTLLLEAHPEFADRHKNSRDFFLISRIEDSTPARHDRVWIALAILSLMVLVASLEWLSMLNAAMLAAGGMIMAGCCSGAVARRSIDWQVLIVIGASFGLGRAMETTGAARTIAETVLSQTGDDPWAALVIIYGLTMCFTELMSNNASAVLIFPIAMATAKTLETSYLPFVMAIMIAASCGFATPIGYQTNLMVYGPGGYRFSDYLRFGGILNLLIWAVAVAIIPWVWPFHP
ncbi:MAG: SLC13 family permease [Deltaproteobacteria bacterium]|nr:SLC13 family permease [Deltaproteobacteria bacterium]